MPTVLTEKESIVHVEASEACTIYIEPPGTGTAGLMILNQNAKLPQTLYDTGAMALSRDGSHAQALQPLTFTTYPGDVDRDGQPYAENSVLLELLPGQMVEIPRFVHPKKLENQILIQKMTQQIQLQVLEHRFSTLTGCQAFEIQQQHIIIPTQPDYPLRAPAIKSRTIDGLTKLDIPMYDQQVKLIFDDNETLQSARLIAYDQHDVPLRLYTSVTDGAGDIWLRGTDPMAGRKPGYVLIYDGTQSQEAALVQIQEPNPLFLTNAHEQTTLVSDILAELTDEGWQFGESDGLYTHIAQINVIPTDNHPVGTLPVYVVYRANQANDDWRAKEVYASIAHDVHMNPGSPGISLEIPECRGFIFLPTGQHITYGIQPGSSNWEAATVNLYNNTLKNKKDTIIYHPDVSALLEEDREMVGMYLFMDPIVAPDGNHVRAIMVTNTESTGNKIWKKLKIGQ